MVDKNDVFIGYCLLSSILVLIPLPWHLQAWNTGTCLYMIWTALGSLNLFINAIIWRRNAINWAPVWCDISSRVFILLNTALPAASLCINRRLYQIAAVKSATITQREKRRAITVDLLIGVGIPFLGLAAEYIVQGHRFDIFENIGCFPFTYNTPLAFVFVYTWPLIIGIVSGVYSTLTIRAFLRRRALFKELLSANTNLTANRYFRLMGLAGVELIGTIPFSIWGIYENAAIGHVRPWKSWADTHYHFSKMNQIPAIIWESSGLFAKCLEITRWTIPTCGFIFFAFFGFAEEARKHYRIAFYSVAKRVGFSSGTLGSSSGTGSGKAYPQMVFSSKENGTLPSFVARLSSKRDSGISTSSSFKSLEKQPADTTFSSDRVTTRISIGSVFHELSMKEEDAGDKMESSSTTSSLPPSHDDKYGPSSPHATSPEQASNSLPHAPYPEITRPAPTLDLASPPRHSADAPTPVGPRGTDDIV